MFRPAWRALALNFNKLYYIAILFFITVISILLSNEAAKIFNKDDPSEVVVDEVAGYLTTMMLIPLSLTNVILGFLLFRFFDIVKPYPSRSLESLKGGYGIVLDDIAAGIWANIVLHLLIKYIL